MRPTRREGAVLAAPVNDRARTYAAEVLGTFILVLGGTTGVVAAGRAHAPILVVVPFAFGFALLAGL